MKSVLLAGAAFMLVAGANFCAAEAQTNSAVRWDATQVAAQPDQQGDVGIVRPTARYDYQYHYGGSPRHPRWEPQGYPAQ